MGKMEIINCRLAEIESEWHRATRPSKLFHEANYKVLRRVQRMGTRQANRCQT